MFLAVVLNPSDFDYLLTKGNNNVPVDRSSLLLKFDPLLGLPVPVFSQVGASGAAAAQQQHLLQLPLNNNPCLSPTLEEDEHNLTNRSFVIDNSSKNNTFEGGICIENGVKQVDCSEAAAATAAESAKLLKERTQEVNKLFKQPLPRQLSGQQQAGNKVSFVN